MRHLFDRTPLKNKLEEIKQLYETGLSTEKIATKLNCSSESIRLLLKKMNVKIRTRNEACSKYNINSFYFSEINDEERSYWLGFITADGSIVNHQLVLSLNQKDISHIQKFLNSIDSNHPIKQVDHCINGKIITQPRVVITCKQIIDDLNQKGIYQNKSLNVKPFNIERELEVSYWRGIFDGDGCISISDTSKEVSLTGNEHIVNGFCSFLKNYGVTIYVQKHRNVWRTRNSKRSDVFDILKILYENSEIYLERKYIIAKNVFSDPLFKLRKNSKLRLPSSEE